MKLKIAIGTGLLLTIGTAVAGGLFYSSASDTATSPTAQVSQTTDVSPEQLAMWRMTADASSYGTQRVPL